jgi:hypothetical protein
VGHKAGLDAVERKISCPCREWNPGRPIRSPSLYRLSQPSSDYETPYDNWVTEKILKETVLA